MFKKGNVSSLKFNLKFCVIRLRLMAAPVSSAEEKKQNKKKQKQNKLIQLPKTLERKELALSDILLYK